MAHAAISSIQPHHRKMNSFKIGLARLSPLALVWPHLRYSTALPDRRGLAAAIASTTKAVTAPTLRRSRPVVPSGRGTLSRSPRVARPATADYNPACGA